jgi:hypothetical protein
LQRKPEITQNAYELLFGNRIKWSRNHAVGSGLIMDERIILKLILNKSLLRVRNVFSWSRIESNGEMLSALS